MTTGVPESPAAVSDLATSGQVSGTSRRTLWVLLQSTARLAALVLVFAIFGGVVGRTFFSPGNIENILMQSAVYAMAGLGMTMVIVIGGIDLAAGSTIALSMVVTAMVLNIREGATLGLHPVILPIFAIICGILAAAFVGAIQGSLITGLRMIPFIVTLGGLVSIRGATKGIADNQEISPPATNWLYERLMFPVQGRTFNWQLFPMGVWATLAAALLMAGVLRYTKFGRRVYAIGSNESTARLCGIPVQRTKLMVYTLAGAFAGLAGVLEFSKLNLGQPTGAQMYELYVIAACVIGGCSLNGGVGTIFGTVIGALMIGTLYAGAQQAAWPKWVQEVAIGIIIVAAVALDRLRTRPAR